MRILMQHGNDIGKNIGNDIIFGIRDQHAQKLGELLKHQLGGNVVVSEQQVQDREQIVVLRVQFLFLKSIFINIGKEIAHEGGVVHAHILVRDQRKYIHRDLVGGGEDESLKIRDSDSVGSQGETWCTSTGTPSAQNGWHAFGKRFPSAAEHQRVFERGIAEKKAAVRHAGQRRGQGLREIHIVKAGDGNVLSDQKIVSPTDAVSGFCHIVVRESDRFKTRVVVQESFHELIDIFGIVAVDDHVFRDRKPVFFHGVAVGGKALVGIAVVLRTADERDLLIMMEIEQMLHAAAGAVVIVRDQIRGIR